MFGSATIHQIRRKAAEILDALLTKYADSGLSDLENVDVLKVDPIKQYGTQVYIVNTIFGGIAEIPTGD